ncbi:hypothetical protein [Nocardia transvalensis]|uniref:hypothetical protein n=1 Tax=Nocardia transvalensis TaxID=37333 RepID=UPI0018956EAD|nr:hypothetical protein [Nocardia transvalensis]MBF6332336.1 hypothetical protein [Nocardia transvalensis]
MLVDPAILRSFAAQVGEASKSVSDAGLKDKLGTSGDGMSGSALQWAARSLALNVAAPLTKFAQEVGWMGDAVHGTATKFEITDDDLAGRFNMLYNDPPKAKPN